MAIETKSLTVVQIGDESCRIEARGFFSDKDAADFVPSPESSQMRIDVPAFEGPLDLLLHLIKKHSMDIFDIPIVLITQKYLEALDEIVAKDLDIAGEFLLMAATLAQIKSKMLLPDDEKAEEIDEDAGIDPRAELVRRLLEYQRYKEAAVALGTKCQLGTDVFLRPVNEEETVKEAQKLLPLKEQLATIELFELVEILAAGLAKQNPKVAHAIRFEPVSVRARILEMIDFVRLRDQFAFEEAVAYFGGQKTIDLILTFLAVLEMARLHLIHVAQAVGEPIKIEAIRDNLAVSTEELLKDVALEGEVV